MKIVCYNNVKSTIECNSVLSEMVWYYIEGCNNRYIEDFLKESDFNYYYAEVDGHNFKFYKNKISKDGGLNILIKASYPLIKI